MSEWTHTVSAWTATGMPPSAGTVPVSSRLRTRKPTASGVGVNSSCQPNITTEPSARSGRSAKNSATAGSPAAAAASHSSLPASV